jgi:hypothetical protein
MLNRLFGRELTSGDHDFDREVMLDGQEADMRLFLAHPKARECLRELVRRSAEVREGWVTIKAPLKAKGAVRARVKELLPLVKELMAVHLENPR